jgi:hypothetical protein
MPRPDEQPHTSLVDLKNQLKNARYKADLARRNHDWERLSELQDRIIPDLEHHIAELRKKDDDLASEEY